ncbi:MAG: hypothetical protein FD126_1357 [Elusimicrobia bacterium]|nr:MAG: hypothetical protein FD126_1357 [Elusimicrobiota bacterium]
MRNILLLTACLSLSAAAPLWADDETAEAEPAAEEAAPAPKKAPKAELPGLKAPAAAEAPKAACLVSGPAAKSVGCAGSYQKVSDGFEKVETIENQIKTNESEVTGLKLQRSKEAKAKLKELDKANRVLWKELDAARREQDALCKGFTRAASAKVKELVSDVTKLLSEAQKSQ